MSVFFAFFFLSGFCGLVYQVVWLRVAMAAFGVTTPLVSIVLSIFMAGLALGSWAGGRLVRSFEPRPASFFISFYGAIELAIGISGLAVAPLLRAGRAFLSDQGTSHGSPWGSPGYYLASAAWIGAVMLPFCTCMGATFPLAMAGIQRAFRRKSSTSFSYLYLANVLGAMAGTMGSAFVFIEILGFSKTLWLAAALNALIAAAAFAFARIAREPPGQPASEAISAADENLPVRDVMDSAPARSVALPLLFSSGLASLGMEVVWTRQFIPILGPVVYAFAAILAVYLGATAVGSRTYRIWVRRQSPMRKLGASARHHSPKRKLGASARHQHSAKDDYFVCAAAVMLAGGCAFLPLLATDPRILVHSYFSKVLLILLGIGPFCAVVGFMTSMLVDRWSQGNPNRAGRAYAVNAVGCILGPLLAGFALLPAFGERGALLVLALPFFGFGVWFCTPLAAVAESKSRPALAMLLAAVSVTSVTMLTLTRDFETLFPHALVRRDYTATSIAAGQGMQRRLLINGIGITSLTPITKMMVHLPLASLPAPPRRVLILCFGMGTSFRSALSWNVPVTVVELAPSVPSLAGYFHADGDQLLRSPNATVVIDDARRYLERTRESFDAIVIDPPPPIAAAGSSLLYSTEFYQVARQHLRPGGILQQWLPNGDAMVKSAFAQSLRQSFRDVRVFSSVEGWGYHFLASGSPISRLSAESLAENLPAAAARDLIEWGPGSSALSQFQIVLGRELQIEDLIQGDPSAPLLTDDRPVNEYHLLRQTLAHRHRAAVERR